jgi:hypothetical protein
MRSGRRNNVRTKYYVTDLNDNYLQTAEMFLGEKISESIEKIELE